MRIHNVFHASLLSLAPANRLPGQNNPPLDPIRIGDHDEWEVADILDSRRNSEDALSTESNKLVGIRTCIGTTLTTASSTTHAIFYSGGIP